MASASSVNLRFGLVALLLLHGALAVQGHGLLIPGNDVFHPKEATDVQNRIIALLLRKSLAPLLAERNEAFGLEMANKLAVLEEMEALKEDLELRREVASDRVRKETALPSKRGCFWKYCV